MQDIALALVSVNNPILCGLYRYEGGKPHLFYSIQSDEKTFESLPKIFEPFLSANTQNLTYKHMNISRIFYANGPGNFTSIKLTHIFLQTLQSIYDFELFATSSFYFTTHPYIKAFGQTYFYRDSNGEILTTSTPQIKTNKNNNFYLPQELDETHFNTHAEPLYVLPPV